MRIRWLEARPINWPLWLGAWAFSAILNFLYVHIAYPMGVGVVYRLSAWLSAQAHFALFIALAALSVSRARSLSVRLATAIQTLTIVGLFVYAANYLYFNIQNVHLNYGIAILSEGGVTHVLDNIRVSGLSQSMTIVYAFVVAGMFVAGLFITRATERLTQLKKWKIRDIDLAGIALAGGLLVAGEQALGKLWKQNSLWAREQTTLPLYITLVDAERASFWGEIPVQLKNWSQEPQGLELLNPLSAAEKRAPKPHLFLILLESFRADAVEPEASPHLWKLSQSAPQFALSYANANATHNSWWSIFHARLPYDWDHERKKGHPLPGSPWLHWFRRAGYRVQVFCQPVINLGYFDFGKLIYGENLNLASSIFRSSADLISPESDHILTQALLDSLKNSKDWETPTLTILYLDGAHFNYSWGKEYTAPFRPYSDDLDLTTLPYLQGGLQLIHNRYRNAVSYVDHLYGQIEDGLKKAGLYDKSGLVISGDHGEEFLEHGAFLHSHTLYDELTRTPILLKLPQGRILWEPQGRIASQIHLFPTLADLAGMDATRLNALEGRSLLRPDPRHLFALSSAVYKTQSPYRYVLSNGRHKLVFDLDRNHPEKTQRLKIRKFTTLDDRDWRPESASEVLNVFEREFAPHLRHVGFIESVQGAQ